MPYEVMMTGIVGRATSNIWVRTFWVDNLDYLFWTIFSDLRKQSCQFLSAFKYKHGIQCLTMLTGSDFKFSGQAVRLRPDFFWPFSSFAKFRAFHFDFFPLCMIWNRNYRTFECLSLILIKCGSKALQTKKKWIPWRANHIRMAFDTRQEIIRRISWWDDSIVLCQCAFIFYALIRTSESALWTSVNLLIFILCCVFYSFFSLILRFHALSIYLESRFHPLALQKSFRVPWQAKDTNLKRWRTDIM